MEKHEADFGWVVTCGTFSEDAEAEAEKLLQSKGYRIRLIDGEELAKLIVEIGMSEVQTL
jgi:restriction endonuclease Mrr